MDASFLDGAGFSKTVATRYFPIENGLSTMDLNCCNDGDTLNDSYPKRAAGPVGKPIPHIQEARLANFTSIGQYESQNLLW